MDKKEKTKICCICRRPYKGYGNNAMPFDTKRCCDRCNRDIVIPLRVMMLNRQN